MTKDEFKQQYIKWAGICGIAEGLGEDLDKSVEDIIQGIPPSILETAGEADIEKTTIAAVLSTRFARDWGDKTLNAQVALFAICCSGILYQMQSEIDALKEKMRWRDENVEPAPRGERVLVYCIDYDASDGVHDTEMEHMYCPDGELAYPYTWWRPLDLPEESK